MHNKGRDVSVGTATGWKARVRVLELQDFSLLHSVQTESGVQPAGGSFPGVTVQGQDYDYSPASSADVKNCGALPPVLPTS
jgi:hypothetical protein